MKEKQKERVRSLEAKNQNKRKKIKSQCNLKRKIKTKRIIKKRRKRRRSLVKQREKQDLILNGSESDASNNRSALSKYKNAANSKEDILPHIQNQNSDQRLDVNSNDYPIDSRNDSSMLIKNSDTDTNSRKEIAESKHKSFDQNKTFDNKKTSAKSIDSSLNNDLNIINKNKNVRPQGPREGVDMFNALMEQ